MSTHLHPPSEGAPPRQSLGKPRRTVGATVCFIDHRRSGTSKTTLQGWAGALHLEVVLIRNVAFITISVVGSF